MCGDLEEDGAPQEHEQLYDHFLAHARALLGARGSVEKSAQALHLYMDKLFADALNRCVKDTEGAPANERYELMSAQPLAFARLAGFLAGHCDLHEDPLRRMIEALMMGYAEAESPAGRDHHHEHEDSHGHYGHQH